jgi:hypothetical protein
MERVINWGKYHDGIHLSIRHFDGGPFESDAESNFPARGPFIVEGNFNFASETPLAGITRMNASLHLGKRHPLALVLLHY